MSVFPARRVLIPVDLTEVSGQAWAAAKKLAEPDAVLETLFVYDAPAAPPFGLPAPPLTRAARAQLLERLRVAYPGSRSRVDEGDPAFRILSRAGRADLVVMASHRRGALGRLVLGSVCETVVRDSPVPVLALRERPGRISSVLAPINMEGYARMGLELAADAALALGARLCVLHVATDETVRPNPRFFLEQAVARLPAELRRKLDPVYVIRIGDPLQQILAESRGHGLVVLTAHRKAVLSDYVLGTTAERVLRHSRVHVLTAPSGRAAREASED